MYFGAQCGWCRACIRDQDESFVLHWLAGHEEAHLLAWLEGARGEGLAVGGNTEETMRG